MTPEQVKRILVMIFVNFEDVNLSELIGRGDFCERFAEYYNHINSYAPGSSEPFGSDEFS